MRRATAPTARRHDAAQPVADEAEAAARPTAHAKAKSVAISPAAAATLHRLYADWSSPGAYAGVAALRAAAARENLRLTHAQVAQFLRSEPTYGLHRAQRVRFARRRVISFDVNWLWELDTAFMLDFARYNDGFAYLLVKIDVLSKQLAVEPMRTKNAGETLAALQRICDRIGSAPLRIACDAGGEFRNEEFLAWAKARRIRVYFVTQSPHGAANVERVIRTLKARIYRYMSQQSRRTPRVHYRYVNVLQQLVDGYNRTRHRSIGMPPADVNERNVEQVRARLYPHEMARRVAVPSVYRYAVGDLVRHAEPRGDFHRGFLPQFTEEVFRVHTRRKTLPATYTLARLDDGAYAGVWNEAQLVPFTPEQVPRGALPGAAFSQMQAEDEEEAQADEPELEL